MRTLRAPPLGRVIGVMPQQLVRKELAHAALTALHVTLSMHARKSKMAELAEGFIALPGGIGTLEEIFEIWTWAQLGLHGRPCGLLNVDGCWRASRAMRRPPCRSGSRGTRHNAERRETVAGWRHVDGGVNRPTLAAFGGSAMTRSISSFVRAACLAAAGAVLLSACGGGSDDGGPNTGTLNINVTDAPVDGARHVYVTFAAIEVKPEGGPPVTYDIDPDRRIDLYALRNGGSAPLLQGQAVPAGRYEWMRLQVVAQQNNNASVIELLDGRVFPLFIPSGEERGLQLIRGFTVAQGGTTDFTIDFDLRRSIIAPPGLAPNYLLKPVLRVVDNLRVGRIEGTVAASLVTAGCTPFVYVFQGAGVTPDDMDSDPAPDVDPLVSAPVTQNATTGAWGYRVSFLETGSYTLAFTCSGSADHPETNETLTFSAPQNATVTANATTTINF